MHHNDVDFGTFLHLAERHVSLAIEEWGAALNSMKNRLESSCLSYVHGLKNGRLEPACFVLVGVDEECSDDDTRLRLSHCLVDHSNEAEH